MSEAIVVSRPAAPRSGRQLGSGTALSGADVPEVFAVAVERLANGGLAVIARGELDLATHDQLRGALDDARARGTLAEIDLSDLTFMDVTAVQVVLDAGVPLGSSGPPPIIRVGRVAARLLNLAHVEHRLELRPPRGDTGDQA
jgi:anti-anti-sigma factor